jgi:hypothetical protein
MLPGDLKDIIISDIFQLRRTETEMKNFRVAVLANLKVNAPHFD